MFLGGNGRFSKINNQTKNLVCKEEDEHGAEYKYKTVRGGAILGFNSNIYVKNCHFIKNKATQGGAICVRAGTEANIVSSLFYSNLSNKTIQNSNEPGGGAVYFRGEGESKNNDENRELLIFINNNSFIYNETRTETNFKYICGGAIYFANWCKINEVSRNLFASNRSSYVGGAIYSCTDIVKNETKEARITKNLFLKNSITNPWNNKCGGSSIAIDDKESKIIISENWFVNDIIHNTMEQSIDGSVLRLDKDENIEISNNYFINNHFIQSKGCIVSLLSCNIKDMEWFTGNSIFYNKCVLNNNYTINRSIFFTNAKTGFLYFDGKTLHKPSLKVDLINDVGFENNFNDNNFIKSNAVKDFHYSNFVFIDTNYFEIVIYILFILFLIFTYPILILIISRFISVFKYGSLIIELFLLIPYSYRGILKPYLKELRKSYPNSVELENRIAEVDYANKRVNLWLFMDFMYQPHFIYHILQNKKVNKLPIIIQGSLNFDKEAIVNEISIKLNQANFSSVGLIAGIHKSIGYSNHLVKALLKKGCFAIILVKSNNDVFVSSGDDMKRIQETRNIYSKSSFFIYVNKEIDLIPSFENHSETIALV